MYFSVKRPIKIGGKPYIPCVCYCAPKHLEATVEKLVAQDKAVSYEEEVHFMNGKLLTKTKKTTKKSSKKKETVEETTTEEVATETTEDATEGF